MPEGLVPAPLFCSVRRDVNLSRPAFPLILLRLTRDRLVFGRLASLPPPSPTPPPILATVALADAASTLAHAASTLALAAAGLAVSALTTLAAPPLGSRHGQGQPAGVRGFWRFFCGW